MPTIYKLHNLAYQTNFKLLDVPLALMLVVKLFNHRTKKRNTAQYKDNTKVYFEFDYAYELDGVDSSIKALIIQKM
mgnify:CR=1 FL=1